MAAYRHLLRRVAHVGQWEDLAIRRRTRLFRSRRDPFEMYSEEEFTQRFRLSKQVTLDLLSKIQHLLPDSTRKRGLPIPPRLQLLVTLRYYATGSFQLDMGDCCDMSLPSVSTCVKTVTSAICQLAGDYIKFPSPAEEQDVMRQFAEVAAMPGVIGCVDGVHIPIISPGGEDAELYRCRKGFFSLNIMGVCNSSMLFTNLVVNWQGSAHDARIFSESVLCATLEGGQYRGYLLGDSGYACKSYLLTPIRIPRTVKERHYNASHIKTRNLIERTFGIWKKRFAILSKPMRTALSTSKKIVTACAILHNIAILNKLPIDMPEEELEPINIDILADYDVGTGNARRASIVERFF
ncbi:putative nuclease HARBI1 [Eriocheir sinensis]|uniref:putative nuclease HARBI1 n=1 Tax=Eriocheir sinensis TaxID=95602 RepID=UPI0021C8CEE0|nr:putative nuclease HARBI1 [Eriocheir sinensis]XP_050704111.1 putative nuclease HARBI1 [Eriocheir sinensis]